MKVLQVQTGGSYNARYYRPHELTLSKSLVKLGHQVTLFTSDRYPKWQALEDRRAEKSVDTIDGVTIRRYPSGPETGVVSLMPTLFVEIMKFDWDILHAHTILAPSSFYSAIASALKKRPLVVTQHEYSFFNAHGVKLFFHRLNNTTSGRYTVKRASAVIGLSSSAAVFVQGFGAAKAKTVVIPSSVDTTLFCPGRKSLVKEKWGLEGPIVLYVGRLREEKSVDVLFRAFRELSMKVLNSKLVLVGKGPQENELRQMQIRLGLKNVCFLGRVPQEDMPRIYPGCDLLVLPSLYEPFGNVVLEGLASGLPVVGSEIGGIADVITNGETGFHIRPGSAKDLSKYMQLLLKDDGLRKTMGAAARKLAVERFDDMVVAKKVESLYYQCVKR